MSPLFLAKECKWPFLQVVRRCARMSYNVACSHHKCLCHCGESTQRRLNMASHMLSNQGAPPCGMAWRPLNAYFSTAISVCSLIPFTAHEIVGL
eukprot:1036187-Pleurochrysis_carterae.AAC.2